jgi:hypothetical protein
MEENVASSSQEERERFFDECCMNIDHLYPNWTRNGYGNHPICIPECLDINKRWIKVGDNEATMKKIGQLLKGQKSEKRTHAALQTCTVGGLAVFDFDLSNFCSHCKFNREGEQFQIDALLFHPNLGICELETKSSAEKTEDAENGLNKAGEKKQQLKRHAEKLRNFYKKVTGCSDNDVPPIRSYYCIPTDKSKYTWAKSSDGKYSKFEVL